MAAKVGCQLRMYEAKAKHRPKAAGAAPGGIIEIRIRLRYQLCIKVEGTELLVDDIVTPEFVTPFAMPLTFLLPELSIMQVSNMLAGLNVEAKVRDFVSPKIAKFGVDAAKRQGGAAGSGLMTVAQLFVIKIDFIRQEEFDRISRTLKQEAICGSSKDDGKQLKSEENMII